MIVQGGIEGVQWRARASAALASAAAALAVGCVSSCANGGAGAGVAAAGREHGVALPQLEVEADFDDDSDVYRGEHDVDNVPFPTLASPRDAHAAASVVRRYFAAVARGDGAAACALMTVTRAESLAMDHGASAGTANEYNETCAQAASFVFGNAHFELAAQSATLRVAEVRLLQRHAAVRMTTDRPARDWYIGLQRERGRWRVVQPLPFDRPIETN